VYHEPTAGGSGQIDEEGYIDGAPDLVAEVAASTTSFDLRDKLQAYQRNGVRECIVLRVLTRAVDWYVLSNESFEKLSP
jgi:Uma2 family endonuclease